MKKIKQLGHIFSVFLLLAFSTIFVLASKAHGANLTTTYIRLNRMKAGQNTSFRLQFRTASAGATSVAINFNGADSSTWTGNNGAVNATQSTNTATCASETGDTALPGSISAAGSGSTITISSVTALSSSTTYCVDLTSSSAVTNADAGEYHPTITVGSDSQTVGLRTIAEDSIVVTASVPASFNFVFNNTTTDAFGNLSLTGTTSTSGKNITLTTNAGSGWIVWAKSANGTTKGSLQSAANSNYKLTSSSSLGSAAHSLTNGTEDYGLAVTNLTDASGGGTVSADAAYDSTSGTKVGVLDSQNFRPIASANGTANGDVVSFVERATISTATPTGTDYTDTITFIGAGNF